METPDNNAGIKWGYGFDSAEWQMAGNDELNITEEQTSETGNEEQVKGNVGPSQSNTIVNAKKPSVIEIFRKLNRLPMGSVIGMHQVDYLSEHEQDQVLLSLVVAKGVRKFSKPMEMLAKNWLWYIRETMVEMCNNETDMSEAIFKAMYLEDEVKLPDATRIALASILPLVGIDWPKKVQSGKGLQVEVIGLIAKDM